MPAAMSPRLLLALALWTSCSPSGGREVAPARPRVWCRALRYPVAVDCSWTLQPAPDSSRATSFIATYRLGVADHAESRPCLQPAPEATRCTIPDVHLFSTVPYVLNVTAVHAAAGAHSSFVPFVAEDIIRPDPPGDLRLSPLPGRRLRVWWEPPPSWPFPDLFALKYRIRYRRHGATRFREVGPIEATSFVLQSVRPQARYYVQVAAQDVMDYGEPSDWSLPAVTPGALASSKGHPAP